MPGLVNTRNTERRNSLQQNMFTLIELMVVISIIAILASLLLPALNKAKSMSKGAKCLSGMKQTALGLLYYAENYNDFLPSCLDNPAGVGDFAYMFWYAHAADELGYKIPMDVTGYLKGPTPDIFVCPARPAAAIDYTQKYNGLNYRYADQRMGMVANTNVLPHYLVTPNHIRLGQIRNPSRIVMFMEGSTLYETIEVCSDLGHAFYWSATNRDIVKRICRFRHSLGSNMAFVDGHAEWGKIQRDSSCDYLFNNN